MTLWAIPSSSDTTSWVRPHSSRPIILPLEVDCMLPELPHPRPTSQFFRLILLECVKAPKDNARELLGKMYGETITSGKWNSFKKKTENERIVCKIMGNLAFSFKFELASLPPTLMMLLSSRKTLSGVNLLFTGIGSPANNLRISS
ncbi:hypothetical protein TNCV_4517291 [Trichonephila clavipes]|nr:hypothetical protein TNCV_4517291 [Trichonephila clavipes]